MLIHQIIAALFQIITALCLFYLLLNVLEAIQQLHMSFWEKTVYVVLVDPEWNELQGLLLLCCKISLASSTLGK